MTIRRIQFTRPVYIGTYAPAGTDEWRPEKYPHVSVAKKDGGIALTWTERGESYVCQVPMTNVDQVLYVEDPQPKKGGL